MAILATKKATKQLQQVLDTLGVYGGTIEVPDSDTYWNLDFEVHSDDNGILSMFIGVYKKFYGDIMFDPCFSLRATMVGSNIQELEITRYISSLPTGIFQIGNDNMMRSSYGSPEKDAYGLRKRFSSFMDYVTLVAPYLTNPLKIRKYDRSW